MGKTEIFDKLMSIYRNDIDFIERQENPLHTLEQLLLELNEETLYNFLLDGKVENIKETIKALIREYKLKDILKS